jgi:hypothetical protein
MLFKIFFKVRVSPVVERRAAQFRLRRKKIMAGFPIFWKPLQRLALGKDLVLTR